jgi:SAM-dependent methyltransferase
MKTPSTPEMDAIKARMHDVWVAGDFGEVARHIEHHAEDFMARRGLRADMQVLDVACGTGNLALLAARAGARTCGLDIAENLVEQARARAAAAGLDIEFIEADAEDIPYEDASFDQVLSMYGAMFAPRPEVAADGQAALRRDLEDLWARHNQGGPGRTQVQGEYLEVVARRA